MKIPVYKRVVGCWKNTYIVFFIRKIIIKHHKIVHSELFVRVCIWILCFTEYRRYRRYYISPIIPGELYYISPIIPGELADPI